MLRLSGIIGKAGVRCGISLDNLNNHIEEAFKPSKLLAVCLIINSPGGVPVQAELISKKILQLAKEKDTPIYTFIEDIAASGGYWLACIGDEIYALKSSVIGSIGVVSSSFGLNNAISKLGIERRIHVTGKNKAILDPFLPEKDDDIKMLKGIQKQIYTHFIEYIKSRRKAKITQTDDVLFNGAIWAGETALDYGLIDGILDFYSFVYDKFGKDVHLKYINKTKQSWIRKTLGITSADITDAIVNKIEEKIYFDRLNFW